MTTSIPNFQLPTSKKPRVARSGALGVGNWALEVSLYRPAGRGGVDGAGLANFTASIATFGRT